MIHGMNGQEKLISISRSQGCHWWLYEILL